MLGKIKRLLLGEQFTQFVAYVWKHLIQQEKSKHIHQNVPRAALQFGACGKFTFGTVRKREPWGLEGSKWREVKDSSTAIIYIYLLSLPINIRGRKNPFVLSLSSPVAGSFRGVS